MMLRRVSSSAFDYSRTHQRRLYSSREIRSSIREQIK